jgi:hypothetical protein
MITEIVVVVLFAILGLAVISWILIIIPEFSKFLQVHKRLNSFVAFVFNAAPVQEDAEGMSPPVRAVTEGIIPIVLWLLIIVPMFVFPIILIIFPLFHIPWSYLLPSSP